MPIVRIVLTLLLALLSLPQTLVGVVAALLDRCWGHDPTPAWMIYQVGPVYVWVIDHCPFFSTGISLGCVIFTDRPEILLHEFCHIPNNLWLTWLYLPVYGVEYSLCGHDGSPHERWTCRLTERWSSRPKFYHLVLGRARRWAWQP